MLDRQLIQSLPLPLPVLSIKISGVGVVAQPSPLSPQSLTSSHSSVTSHSDMSKYSFLVEEVIEQDGVYEDVIAVDYKNM